MIVSGLASGSRVLFPTTKVWAMDALFFHNIGRLASNKSPVQIVHGTHDEVVAFSNGQDLHAACAKHHPLPPAWIDGATHNNLETVHSVAYMRAFKAFLKHLLATPPNDPPPKSPSWFDWIPGLSSSPHREVKVEPASSVKNETSGAGGVGAGASKERAGPTSDPLPNPWARNGK